MQENWKEIPGWEGYYEVSDTGKIRSRDRVIKSVTGQSYVVKGQPMKLHLSDGGYLWTYGSKFGVQKRIWVHRAVLEAFKEKRPNGMVAMHIDNNPLNNRLENLMWGTQKMNICQSVRDGRQANVRKKKCLRGHEFHDWNLVAFALRKGKRSCLACYKVTHVHRVKEVGEAFVQLESDNNYRELRLANLQKSQ